MNEYILQSPTISGTDSTDTKYILNGGPSKVTVLALWIEPQVTVATHAANYITTTISDGTTTLGTHTTNSSGGSALTEATGKAVTLSTSAGAALDIASGSSIKVAVTKAGTGPAYNFRVIAKVKAQR